MQVVGREFTSDKATDFMAILTKIKSKSPDAVFYGGMDAQAAPMLRQLRQLGYSGKFLGGDGVCTGGMLSLSKSALSLTSIAPRPAFRWRRCRVARSSGHASRSASRPTCNCMHPYSYDAAMALIEAMKNAGSAEPGKYLPALQKLDYKGVTGNIAFDQYGDVKEAGVTLYQFENGSWKPLN